MRRSSTAADRYRAAKKKQIMVLAVLMGLLVVMWAVFLLKGKPQKAMSKPVSTQTTPDLTETTSGIGGELTQEADQVEIKWPALLPRDPFYLDPETYGKKQTTQSNDQPIFILQGTILGDDPRALINGKAIGIGQSIGGAVVKEITHGHVIIELDGTQMKLGH